ncbi:PPOX class F420-dependent oxidoreductase [Streptomonospora wellingtoniae]|uniref:PPOX class F420-dependent oxidoreductase n=1 Tax=Streptomonospora wellingtoniae TaxID=3075544 RepID=A0ABU2KY73_9ACTN|nr:PPOX class F420-dependent oxidoreductase [Streptomonospora sp. DSM 45055]MDT0304197.1 PPOX class F420-dependent oxidoreductase [Streptomonospora sp. DSM 45055]
MSAFTETEIAYLIEQPLGRLATVGPDGLPQVKPVGVFYDPENDGLVVGGIDMAPSKKFRDATANPEVAVVVDDLASVDPWSPRGIEVRGRAETRTEGGEATGERLGAGFPFSPAWILIHPRRVVCWGIGSGPFEFAARTVA